MCSFLVFYDHFHTFRPASVSFYHLFTTMFLGSISLVVLLTALFESVSVFCKPLGFVYLSFSCCNLHIFSPSNVIFCFTCMCCNQSVSCLCICSWALVVLGDSLVFFCISLAGCFFFFLSAASYLAFLSVYLVYSVFIFCLLLFLNLALV